MEAGYILRDHNGTIIYCGSWILRGGIQFSNKRDIGIEKDATKVDIIKHEVCYCEN
jgi:hypothetical protein